MVYGYDTNKEFIDKSYQLLEKLEAKDLWNKDTLVIGLDKSVRPLAYALKKISDVEKREPPDIRFFNFSSQDIVDVPKSLQSLYAIPSLMSNYFKEKVNPIKFFSYKNILVLDNVAVSGKSLKEVKTILQNYLLDLEHKPKISLATLGIYNEERLNLDKKDLIFIDKGLGSNSLIWETGINDKIKDRIQISTPVKDKKIYKEFIQNRKQLSKDIKQYIHEKHPKKVKKQSSLENKLISGFFVLSFLVGLFLIPFNLTGNVIGTSGTAHRLFGIILILFGLSGFFIYRELSKD